MLLFILPVIWCLVETIVPYLIKIVIDKLAMHGSNPIETQRVLINSAFSYTAMILLLELSIRACQYVWMKTFPSIRADIQAKVLELTQEQPYQFIYNQLAGDLINKYRNLTESFEQLFKMLLYGFYPTVLSFFFSLILIALISKAFSILFLFWFLAMNAVTFFYLKQSIHAANKQSGAQSHLIGYVGNFICNAITMITFPRRLSKEKEFLKLLKEGISSTERSELVIFKTDLWRGLLSWVLLVSMVVFLSFGWTQSWITLGDFSFIGATCFYIRRTIWVSSAQLSDFLKVLGIAEESLSLIIKTKPGKHNFCMENQQGLSKSLKASLELNQIQFNYLGEKPILNNINLQIPAGEKLGIMGSSGAGKTSLVYLLLRIYDPAQGTLMLNGQNYSELEVENLRDHFSYVPQNVSLLHCSIFDNIAFGKENASKDEVYEAARICLCDEFILAMKNGYETIIGEGGCKLSGGQRQRIAIARAYIKRAPIFILDEALTGLDPALEKNLIENLCENLKNHTLIVISHNLSVLSRMDRLVEFKQGRIIHDGYQANI